MFLQTVQQACSNCHPVHGAIQQASTSSNTLAWIGAIGAITGGIGACVAAIISGFAASISRESAKASEDALVVSREAVQSSKDAAEASRISADIMQKQYQDESDQKRPLLEFGKIELTNKDRDNYSQYHDPTRCVLHRFTIPVKNKRQEYLEDISYIYAFYSDNEIIDIGFNFHSIAYSCRDHYIIDEIIQNPKKYPNKDVYLFLFVNVHDINGKSKFAIYGEKFDKSCCNNFNITISKKLEPIQHELTAAIGEIYAEIINMSKAHLRYNKRDKMIRLLEQDALFIKSLEQCRKINPDL
ncbi:hypothetical protein [Geothrix sp. 21YS21S-2]|uniref:hypothetical protein n=1 Tax=Geothrix sp. 21YS21S-2 TaxID=3068893 RepID=UPI0027B9FD5C|nr:hypothetical protein [Geothrix sp. 21YS21S-2]